MGGGEFAGVSERGEDLMVDRISIDGGYGHTKRHIVRDGRVRKVEFSIELIDPDALLARLEGAGFADVQLLGADGEPFDPEGTRLIALARR
jgi:hypothetical protein